MDIAEKSLQLKQDFDDVYEAGKSEFWDEYQNNGVAYFSASNMFGNPRWTKYTFKPKYDIKGMEKADRMFYLFNGKLLSTVDLVDLLEKQGRTIDFKGCTNFYYTFEQAYIHRIGIIDCSSGTNMAYTFNTNFLQTIEKLIVSESTAFVNSTFGGNKIANINAIEGNFGVNMTFSACPLTKASITNVVNALSDSTSGLTCTFKKTAKEAAFTADEWTSLISTKSNWTFSLI